MERLCCAKELPVLKVGFENLIFLSSNKNISHSLEIRNYHGYILSLTGDDSTTVCHLVRIELITLINSLQEQVTSCCTRDASFQ